MSEYHPNLDGRYIPNASTAENDREVIALADFLSKWAVLKSDYAKLATAARWLSRSCRDRLPQWHYAKLEDECREIDSLLSLNARISEPGADT